MSDYVHANLSPSLHEFTASKSYLNKSKIMEEQEIYNLFIGLNTMFIYGPRTCDTLYTFRFVPAKNINLIIDIVKLITLKEFVTNTFVSTTYQGDITAVFKTDEAYFERIGGYVDDPEYKTSKRAYDTLYHELKKYIKDTDESFNNILNTHNFILMFKIPKDYPVIYYDKEYEILLPFNSKIKLVDYFFGNVDRDIPNDKTDISIWKNSFTYYMPNYTGRPIRNCYLTVECLPYTKDQFSELEKYSFNPDE